MTAPAEDRIDWEALLVTLLLAAIAIGGVGVFLKLAWQFRHVLWPFALLAAVWLCVPDNTAPRKST